MSMAFDIFCLTFWLASPTAVALLTWIGVGGYSQIISSRVVRMGVASWPFRNMVPNSASAADATIFFMILYKTYTHPLRRSL